MELDELKQVNIVVKNRIEIIESITNLHDREKYITRQCKTITNTMFWYFKAKWYKEIEAKILIDAMYNSLHRFIEDGLLDVVMGNAYNINNEYLTIEKVIQMCEADLTNI